MKIMTITTCKYCKNLRAMDGEDDVFICEETNEVVDVYP